MSGKICPKCEKDIGVLTVMKAPIPNRYLCPHCATKLKYLSALWPARIASFVAYVVVMVLLLPLLVSWIQIEGLSNVGLGLILVFVFWQPVQLAFALYLRNKSVLFFRDS